MNSWDVLFGDQVTFTRAYARFIGRRAVWPRGDRSRYVDVARLRHISETVPHHGTENPVMARGYESTVWWGSVPYVGTGIFAGAVAICSSAVMLGYEGPT